MKSIVFIHDHIFKKRGETVFSSASLSYENMSAYRSVGELTVLARGQEQECINSGLAVASGENIRHVLLPNFKSLKGLIYLPYTINQVKKTTANADLVVARLPSILGIIAYLLTSKRTTVLVEVVGNAKESLFSHGSLLGKLIARPVHAVTKRIVYGADNVAYITEEYLQSIYPRPLEANSLVCSNALVEAVSEDVLNKRLRRGFKEKIDIGLIGSLDVNYKGHADAIEAIKILNERLGGHEFHLNFVGGGDKRKWLELAISLGMERYVHFIGSLRSGRDVFSFIDSMDLMYQPSLSEGQGRSIIEAMSRACPVLASRTGGITELYDNKYMVTPARPEELALRTERMIREEDYLQDMIKHQYRASLRFDTAALKEKKISILKRLC